jgi:hypothetical protein
MTQDSIVLDRPGVYLFPKPSRVTVSIDRELLVVFAMPMPQACGFVLFDPMDTSRSLIDALNTLFAKVTSDLKVGDHQIAVKAFGLSRRQESVIAGLMHWLSTKTLHLVARDLGKNVGRNIVVDCATGKVGVGYAESYLPGFPQFLSRGSAKHRFGSAHTSHEVLVLSRNAVCRQLTLQAVEEHKHWTASVPLNPEDMWTGKEFPYFPWSWVLLFQDLEDEEGLVPWVKTIHAEFPKVRFCWVGTRLPYEMETVAGLTLIPPLEPHQIGEFKTNLANVFHAEEPPGEGDGIIPFPKERARRRR